MATKTSRTRSIAAIGVVVSFTLLSLACALVAVYLWVLTYLFNDGGPRVPYLLATILVLMVAVGVAYGGHVLAERIDPKS